MKDSLVIISGGMDSATLLAQLALDDRVREAITFDYGQRHSVEIGYAERLANYYGVQWRPIILPIRELFKGSGSSQVDDKPVPHGHYAAENMKTTVVPYRNLVMLSVAAARARSINAKYVWYGAHAGDHTIYPDCRVEFVDALNKTLIEGDWVTVKIVAPYLDKTKGQIAKLGGDYRVPFGMTWSCYEGGGLHCGLCGACTERKEAFIEAGVEDPTRYAQ